MLTDFEREIKIREITRGISNKRFAKSVDNSIDAFEYASIASESDYLEIMKSFLNGFEGIDPSVFIQACRFGSFKCLEYLIDTYHDNENFYDDCLTQGIEEAFKFKSYITLCWFERYLHVYYEDYDNIFVYIKLLMSRNEPMTNEVKEYIERYTNIRYG